MNKNIFTNLNCNASLDSQRIAINELALMSNLDPKTLLQPLGKEYWENAAIVLLKIGYPKVEVVIPGLFVWLQDMNWPGAMIVFEILESLPKNVIVPYLERAVSEALSMNDEIWIENMSSFLKHFDLRESDFKSKEAFLALLVAQ